MKRTQLKRTPMRRKRGSTKYSRRERDTDRMAWCKTLPCAVNLALKELGWPRLPVMPDACSGPIEAHHAGEHCLGNKSPDDTVIALCDHHHDDLTDRRGIFSGWPRGTLKAWELTAIAYYQRLYERVLATRAQPPIF